MLDERDTTLRVPTEGGVLLVLVALSALGVCFIYSACYVSDDWPVRSQWWRQLVWLSLGGVLYGIVSRVDYRMLHPVIWVGYFASLVLLVLVLFFGVSIGGARRWFRFAGVLFQPAEMARLFTILAFARWFSRPVRAGGFWRLPVGASIVAIPMLLIAVEPSLGNALTIPPAVVCMLVVRFVPRRWVSALCVLTALAATVYVAGLSRVRELDISPHQVTAVLSPYWPWPHHIRRIAYFLSSSGDWNGRQSTMAVAGGGALGKGYRRGTMKMLGYLPRTVAPTDFIFSVIGEEAGFLLGTVPVLFLYGLFLRAGMRWATAAPDLEGTLICTGFTVLFFVHIAVNIGMNIRLVPIVGLPLPFLSYGGTFLVSCLVAVGVMSNIGRQAAGVRKP